VGEHQDEPVGERGEGIATEGVPVGPGRPVAAPPRRLAVADRHPGQPAPLVEPGEQPDELERTTTGPERSR
jgi:hypothetical protein